MTPLIDNKDSKKKDIVPMFGGGLLPLKLKPKNRQRSCQGAKRFGDTLIKNNFLEKPIQE